MRRWVLWTLAFLCLPHFSHAAEPVRLIFDTDMGNDIDDAIALALIHSLENRGEVRLLAVTITKDNRWAAPFVDLVNAFYGRQNIPIGVVHNGKTPEDSAYIRVPSQRRDEKGHYVYPHQLEDGTQAQDAVALLRKILESQPDHSVTIAQVGFSTNLTSLLKTNEGAELVTRKVKMLSLMAGNFQKSEPEYNVYTDPQAAQYLFSHWPTPMVFSGFEIGLKVMFSHESIVRDFAYTSRHPIAEAYNLYLPKGEDRPSWDPTAVLYAIRSDRHYFELSGPGRVSIGEKSVTVFTPDPQGNSRFLTMTPDSACRVKAVLEALASEPPQSAK